MAIIKESFGTCAVRSREKDPHKKIHILHLPLADVVGTDPAADDLVVRLLLGPDCPALIVLVHYHLLLLLDVQTEINR